MKKKLQCLAAALGMGAGAAMAAPGGWLALGVGRADVDFAASDLDDGSFISASEDTGSTALRLGGGFDVNDHFGVDVSYFDSGEIVSFDAVSDGSVFYPAGTISGEFEASGLSFGIDGYLPLNDRFRLVGRVGMLMWDLDATVMVNGASGSASEDGNDPYLGLGMEGDLSPKVGVGLNYLRYDVADDDLNLLELALRYRFGG